LIDLFNEQEKNLKMNSKLNEDLIASNLII